MKVENIEKGTVIVVIVVIVVAAAAADEMFAKCHAFSSPQRASARGCQVSWVISCSFALFLDAFALAFESEQPQSSSKNV